MRPARRVALCGCCCIAAATAMASFPGSDVFVPSVGRGGGAAGSQWYTALWIHNPGVSAANVQVFFLRRDQANLSPSVFNVAIPAGDTVRTDDAIATMFGATGFGALRVVSDQLLLVAARIYSRPPGGELKHTVGQFFAAVPASFAIAAGQLTTLLGVYQTAPQSDSQLRYNFGFVETTGATATVRVTAYDATGLPVGAKDYPLAPFEARQYNIADLLPAVNSTNLRLSVEVLAGPGKVVAFGSGLANASNDPSTFEMAFRPELLGGSGAAAVIHDASLTGDGTPASPLGIANGGVTPPKLSAAGSTSGQVLTSSGSAVSWQNPGGFTLPYTGTVASSDPAFAIANTSGTVALRGLATSTAQSTNYGGYFEAHGPSGRAVAGAANGASAFGVYGLALGSGGRGVVGEASSSGVGVLGKSSGSDGVVGQSETATKSGVYGVNANASGYGIFGRNAATGAVGYLGGLHGVWGTATAALAHGGYFEAAGNLAAGVYGKSTNAYGFGGVFEATGANAVALLALGPPGPQATAAIFRGNVQVRSRSTEAVLVELGEGLDLSEGFDMVDGDEVGPGSVVVLDPAHPGRLALARSPYDHRVAGVVAGARSLGSAVRIGAGGFDRDVALAGRVFCNVDASYGEVRVGDLLTTSPTPGFAMVAKDRERAAGAILGKAMEPLQRGERGQILVLVTLQ